MKNNLYTFLYGSIFTFFLLMANNTIAQPDFYGCHNANHHHKLSPLTPEEFTKLEFSNERSDTLDILNYHITMDFLNFNIQEIDANCEISIKSKMNNVSNITLDLLDLTVDSVKALGQHITYSRDNNFIYAQFPTPLNMEEELTITVYYQGKPTAAAGGFGGLVFQNGIAYNLGIGLGENPYNFGRGWFPCFDTFVERSTYDFTIVTDGNRRAYCVGTFLEETISNEIITRKYSLDQEIPTYLAGIAVGNYSVWNDTHTGQFGDVALELLARPGDIAAVTNSFQYLDESVDALEKWWGPYVWERVGYVMTGNGAMEHPTNVAYPISLADDGPTDAHNRVMAHELGHHWWGDVVTLTGPNNMWIKEGPAEYSAHLFREHTFGRKDFVTTVKNNLVTVLREAHIDDDGYQQLSGIPYEHTYGTHTYQKGALVIHNLRGYLGDDLFAQGMQSVLNTFAYDAIDAEQFRDQLTASTGVDMGPYFDAWIFAPGYAAYEIEDLQSSPEGNEFSVDVSVQQKLRAAPNLHNNVPLDVTFMDDDFNIHRDKIMVSGEFTDANFTVPFEPTVVFLDEEHKLNLAVIGAQEMVNSTGFAELVQTKMGVDVQEITDSAFIRVEHHWVAPDPSPTNVYDATLSKNHYFRYTGVTKDGFVAKGSVSYEGSSPNGLDYDLLSVTEDSLVLLYRPDPTEDWYEYPDYKIQYAGSHTDGMGFVFIEPMIKGEYTFANAIIEPTSNEDLAEKNELQIYPNPTPKLIYIDGKISENGQYDLTLLDNTGKNILKKKVSVHNGELFETLNVASLPVGVYVVSVSDEYGKEWMSEAVKVMR